MHLRGRACTRGGDAEAVHGPREISLPLAPTERQPLAQRWFIYLDDTESCLLQIGHLVLEGERDLATRLGAWLVIAHKRPIQNRHGPRQHPLHRLLSQRLGVDAPADRYRM